MGSLKNIFTSWIKVLFSSRNVNIWGMDIELKSRPITMGSL